MEKKRLPPMGCFALFDFCFSCLGTHVFGSSQKNCTSAPSLLADNSRHWVQIYWPTEEMLIHIAVKPQPKSAFLGHIPIPEVFSSRPLGSFTEKVVVGLMNRWDCLVVKSTSFAVKQHLHDPLQGSCLENPRDGGAWWAAVYGVAQSQTRLKRLSSSSSNTYMWFGLCK